MNVIEKCINRWEQSLHNFADFDQFTSHLIDHTTFNLFGLLTLGPLFWMPASFARHLCFCKLWGEFCIGFLEYHLRKRLKYQSCWQNKNASSKIQLAWVEFESLLDRIFGTYVTSHKDKTNHRHFTRAAQSEMYRRDYPSVPAKTPEHYPIIICIHGKHWPM